MNLLPGERILRESPKPTMLVLTTHRVRLERRSTGFASTTSIMLEEIASCALLRTSQPILLMIAAVCVIGGALVAVNGEAIGLVIGVLVALLFGLLYFASRQQTLSLASAGATIKTSTKGMNLEIAHQMIDAIEAAKGARYLLQRSAGEGYVQTSGSVTPDWEASRSETWSQGT